MLRFKTFLSIIALCSLYASAEYTVNYEGELSVNAGSGDFAPSLIMNNTHGILTQPANAQARAKLWKEMSLSDRFSYGFGADLIAGYSTPTEYFRHDVESGTWKEHEMRGPGAWVQQFYGEIKWRGVFLSAGLKEYESGLVNAKLSSGDLSFSGNTRPLPGFRAGFIDFQDIPLTNGWLQIQGEIGYNKSTDNDWTKQHYNYFFDHINLGWWYNYKRCYFRTKPEMPLSVTFGMQACGQFGGTTYRYFNGRLESTKKHDVDLGSFFAMIVPQTGEDFVKGSHYGTWDLKTRYRLRNGDEISGYFEWPWEDGTGVGKLNGFDGLWGIEYRRSEPGIVNGAVLEYIDFTNQSGPQHWDPVDNPGTDILDQTTGYDNYYNNYMFNSYSIYGMSIGSPMLPAPIYNLYGQPQYLCNRIRGFHAGVMGQLSRAVDYRLLFSYSKGWGTYYFPFLEPKSSTSMMAEINYRPQRIKGLTVKGQFGFDSGKLLGDNIGALLSCSYTGLLTFGKK